MLQSQILNVNKLTYCKSWKPVVLCIEKVNKNLPTLRRTTASSSQLQPEFHEGVKGEVIGPNSFWSSKYMWASQGTLQPRQRTNSSQSQHNVLIFLWIQSWHIGSGRTSSTGPILLSKELSTRSTGSWWRPWPVLTYLDNFYTNRFAVSKSNMGEFLSLISIIVVDRLLLCSICYGDQPGHSVTFKLALTSCRSLTKTGDEMLILVTI